MSVMRSRFRRVRLAPLGCCALLLSGCALEPVGLPPVEAPAARTLRDPAAAVAETDARRQQVSTVTARLDVRLHKLKEQRSFPLNGVYLGNADGSFRLRLKHEELVVLDLAAAEGSMELWLPRKNRFYRGTTSQVQSVERSELALLAQIGSVHDLFFPRAWSERAVERRMNGSGADDWVSVYGRADGRRALLRRLVLLPQMAAFARQELYGPSGALLGQVLYDGYAPQPLGTGGAQVTAPGRVTIMGADRQIALELIATEYSFNAELPTSRFRLAPPEGVQTSDLGAALAQGIVPWQ
ncbi:MAG: hypothetical protein AMXMBFR7_36040 [Planctomycetota bacterium]